MNADVLTIASPSHEATPAPIRIVQLSDPHLFADTGVRLLGINTEASFQAVVDLIRHEQTFTSPAASATSHAVQLLLATGDIAQTPSRAVYQRFLAAMDTLGAPCVWLQGNHDLKGIFQQSHDRIEANCNVIELGHDWVVLMLNSSKENEIGGYFSAAELAWLQRQLASYPDRHLIVALHHHPLPVGSAWIDASGLANAHDFWDIIHGAPQVRLVLHGHSHQEFSAQHGKLSVLGCPSTCIQFKPLSEKFTVDLKPPGYRWLDLYADGHIDSAVSRLAVMPTGIEVDSLGY